MLALAILIFLLIFSVVFAFVMFSSIIGFLMGRVPYVRTRKADILQLADKLSITKNDYFFDLGCGDGKVLFAIEKLSGAKTRGFEITLWTHLWSRIKRLALGSKTELVFGNFFKNNFSDATIIYCYLFPPLMPTVGEKVMNECKSGTRIVSRDFPIPNLKLVGSWKSPTKHILYLYQL